MATTPEIAAEGSIARNDEAEASVLGAVLLDGDTIGDAARILRADSFYNSAHRLIFESMERMYDQNRFIEALTLREELKRAGTQEAIGGSAYLAELVEKVPSTIHIEHYANIVRENAIVRKLSMAAREILEETKEWRGSPRELLDKAEQRIFEVAQERGQSETEHIHTVITQAMAEIESWHGERVTGIETGFHELDKMTTGLQPPQMVILAARPSMGKTTLGINITEHIGLNQKRPIAFFSLETSKMQIVQNMLCSHARINAHSMRGGFLDREGWSRLALAGGALAEAPIFIDDSASLSVLEMKSKARALKAKHNIEVLVIDYLQLMEGPRAESRQQEITAVSRSLKSLARELNVVVIALAQLSRAVEARPGNRPMMSDLRESGSIEQEADIILLLYRDEYYTREKSEKKGLAEVIVAKQRNGPTGSVTLTFMNEYLRFGNSAMRVEDQS